jgi:ubiquinone/menaquinone biosynthesis C-methylase UbiE
MGFASGGGRPVAGDDGPGTREVERVETGDNAAGESGLPGYASMMAHYHRAFARELEEIIAGLPLRPGDRVLDLACGDGSYSRWLARRVGADGLVLAADISAEFLAMAQKEVGPTQAAGVIQFVQADLDQFPMSGHGLDLAWCAQSLYSLPDPVEAVRRMARVVRPGGYVAVFENDEFHHVQFPWPVEIELALKKAELESFVATASRPRKYYVGRELLRVFREAGLERRRVNAIAFTRQAPLDEPSRAFFAEYLDDLRQRVRPHLESSVYAVFDRLANPRSPHCLLESPDLTVTCLNQVAVGVRPGGSCSGGTSTEPTASSGRSPEAEGPTG